MNFDASKMILIVAAFVSCEEWSVTSPGLKYRISHQSIGGPALFQLKESHYISNTKYSLAFSANLLYLTYTIAIISQIQNRILRSFDLYSQNLVIQI